MCEYWVPVITVKTSRELVGPQAAGACLDLLFLWRIRLNLWAPNIPLRGSHPGPDTTQHTHHKHTPVLRRKALSEAI